MAIEDRVQVCEMLLGIQRKIAAMKREYDELIAKEAELLISLDRKVHTPAEPAKQSSTRLPVRQGSIKHRILTALGALTSARTGTIASCVKLPVEKLYSDISNARRQGLITKEPRSRHWKLTDAGKKVLAELPAVPVEPPQPALPAPVEPAETKAAVEPSAPVFARFGTVPFQVLEVLASDPRLWEPKELCAKLNRTSYQIGHALANLCNVGYVEHPDAGKWAATHAGLVHVRKLRKSSAAA